MFKINSEKELMRFLKVVAQESVAASKKKLNESIDSAQERYSNVIRASENMYGVNLTEQEEEEEAKTDAQPQEEDEKNSANVNPEEETEAEEEQIDSETFGVSFDSVIKDINTLRSGRSTKDKEIKEELLGYYDRLDDGERKILHLFLSELSKILQGALEAENAQDPSDPPFNAEITFGSEEDEEAPAQVPKATDASKAGDSEDRSPPIKVNEKQDLNEIRRKIKNLMKRI